MKHHPKRWIFSIYFDTPGRKSLGDNLIGISNRDKFRLRWYSENKQLGMSPNQIRAELKYRRNSLGGKNVFEFTKEQSKEIVGSHFRLPSHMLEDLQDEISLPGYFFNCSPVIQVCYCRDYYIDEAGVRLTIDKQISFSDCCFSKSKNIHWHPFTKSVVEVKYSPILSSHANILLSGLPLRTVRNSKYVLGAAVLGDCTYL